MPQPTATRRDLLRIGTTAAAYAAGAAIVTGGVAAVSAAKGAAPVNRTAWEQAVADFHAAERASDVHYHGVVVPTSAELERRAPRPELFFYVPGKNGSNPRHRVDPSNRGQWEHTGPRFRDAERDVLVRWDAHSAAHAAIGMPEINRRCDELSTALTEAEDRLFETPAPDLSAVTFKLELLWQDDRDQIEGFNRLVLADVRRLSSGEA